MDLYEDESADLMYGMQANQNKPEEEEEDIDYEQVLKTILKGPPLGPCENKIKYSPEYYRFLVPAETAPRCIGPNGKFMRDFKQQLKKIDPNGNVTIHTVRHATGESLVGRVADYIMTVKASTTGLRQTLYWALPRLHIEDHPDNRYDLRTVLPDHAIPLVVGKKGVVIKEIRELTHTYINIHDEPLPLSEEIAIKIQHTNIDHVIECALRIWSKIKNEKCKKEFKAYEPFTFKPADYKTCGSWVFDVAVLLRDVRGGLPSKNNFVYDEGTSNMGYNDYNEDYSEVYGEDYGSAQCYSGGPSNIQAVIQRGIEQGLAKGIKLGMKRGLEMASNSGMIGERNMGNPTRGRGMPPAMRGRGMPPAMRGSGMPPAMRGSGMPPPRFGVVGPAGGMMNPLRGMCGHPRGHPRGMGAPMRGRGGPPGGISGPPRGKGGPPRGMGGPSRWGPQPLMGGEEGPSRGGKIPRGMPASYYRSLMRDMKKKEES